MSNVKEKWKTRDCNESLTDILDSERFLEVCLRYICHVDFSGCLELSSPEPKGARNFLYRT